MTLMQAKAGGTDVSKDIPAGEAPEGAKQKLVGTVVHFISLVDAAANRRVFILRVKDKDPDKAAWTKVVPIKKIDKIKKRVYGIVYMPLETDTDGDYMDEVTVENMAADFLRAGRAAQVDKNHSFIAGEGYVMESWLIRKADPMFPEEKEGSWAVGIQITNEETWAAIEKGELTGLSLGGFAMGEPVTEKSDKDPLEEGKQKTAIPYKKTEVFDEGETDWDKGGARGRVRSWAVGEDDEVDLEKFEQGFAFIDDEMGPDNLARYKLVHHDIDIPEDGDVKDGVLKLHWRGLREAMGMLRYQRGEGLVIPDGERQAVYDHLTKHYEDLEKTPPPLEVPEGEEEEPEKGNGFLSGLKRVTVLPPEITKTDISDLGKGKKFRALVRKFIADGVITDFYTAMELDEIRDEIYGDFWNSFWVFQELVKDIFDSDFVLEEKRTVLTKVTMQFLSHLLHLLLLVEELNAQAEQAQEDVLVLSADVITRAKAMVESSLGSEALMSELSAFEKAGAKMSSERLRRFQSAVDNLMELLGELSDAEEEGESKSAGGAQMSGKDDDGKSEVSLTQEELDEKLKAAEVAAVEAYKKSQEEDKKVDPPEEGDASKEDKGTPPGDEGAVEKAVTAAITKTLLPKLEAVETGIGDLTKRVEALEEVRGITHKGETEGEDDEDPEEEPIGKSFGEALLRD